MNNCPRTIIHSARFEDLNAPLEPLIIFNAVDDAGG